MRAIADDVIELDLCNENSIKVAAKEYGGKPLHLLLNLGGEQITNVVGKCTDKSRLVTSPKVLARSDDRHAPGLLQDNGGCKVEADPIKSK